MAHLSINLLQAKILFKVPILLLLLILSPFFTLGFVMRRPIKTSWRNFRNVAFILSIMLFCRNFLTLLYPVSIRLRAGILL